MKIAVFPGSFDPITLGHIDVIRKSEKIFDKIIIAIGENNSKKNWLKIDKRIRVITKFFKENKKIEIQKYNKLTVAFCQSKNAKFIIRGLRSSADFEYENQLNLMNEDLDSSITTIFIPCSKKYSNISSRLVKEIIQHRGKLDKFLPQEIIFDIKKLYP